MRTTLPLLALALALSAALGCHRVGGPGDEFRPVGAPPVVVSAEEVAERQIDARNVRRAIAFLAADARRGRGMTGPGLDRSAAWIADAFHRIGLEPAGDHGGYLQYWSYTDAGEERQVANVVGRLPGSDLTRAGEYVVLIAHYDHLGVGPPDEDGDSIYNGADDNASGVAALIEVARAFSALPDRTTRPLLFLVVSGHEAGLLGSSRFVADPTVDLTNTVAVLNLDMVGRNHPDSIGVVGYEHSSLGPLIEEIASGTPGLGLTVDRDPAPLETSVRELSPRTELFHRSDHYPFVRLGIAGVQFFSGFHEAHGTPADQPRQVDDDKVARVARLAFLTAHRVAVGEVEPEWTGTAAGSGPESGTGGPP